MVDLSLHWQRETARFCLVLKDSLQPWLDVVYVGLSLSMAEQTMENNVIYNNINFYIAHTPEIQINGLYNKKLPSK